MRILNPVLIAFFVFLSACVKLDDKLAAKNSTTTDSVEQPSQPPSDPVAPPDDNHAPVIEKSNVETGGTLASRYYVAQVLRDAFASTVITVASLEVNLEAYVVYKPGAFGLACNPYSTYTGKDCGGSGGDFISNANVVFASEASTVRQLNTSKVCEVILGRTENSAVYAVAKAINEYSGTHPTNYNLSLLNEVSDTAITNIFSLFYRNRAITPAELAIYSAMNQTLINKNPTVPKIDRWRAIILMICESPDWSVL